MASARELVDLQETLYASKNPTRRWLHCSRRDWIFDAIERHGTGADTGCALEIGPGSAVYLPVLARNFRSVVASDIEEAFLEQARRVMAGVPNLSFRKDDITATALPAKTFDLILCTEVVEHIADSSTAVAQMHTLLRPGGVLILSTPQRYSPLELTAKIAFLPGIIQLVRLLYREPVLKTGHINLMTEGTVRKQLAAAGFKVDETYKSGVYIPLLAEFAGTLGLRFQQRLERGLRGGALSWLLWTQYFIARA